MYHRYDNGRIYRIPHLIEAAQPSKIASGGVGYVGGIS